MIRHAGATQAQVLVKYDPSTVTIEVEDDGAGADGSVDEGHGMIGMRERAEAIGGRLETGTGPERGFRVRALLPANLKP